MGTGRERLSQAHFQWALEHLRAGDLEKAESDLRMSLHINPRHMDAIHLRERLTAERISTFEGSRMRTFMRQLIRSEAGLPPEPMYQRPDVDALLEGASQMIEEETADE